MEKVVIITGPSGAGKNTIADHILEVFPKLHYSVSATTRQPREGEKEGIDYYFISVEAFKEKIKKDEFIEWEEVYTDKYYGTLKSEVNRIWANNCSVLFVVDVVGAQDLKRHFQEKALSIFVMPPSLEVLKNRILGRGSEPMDSLEERLRRAKIEMKLADQFDTILVNDHLEEAYKTAEAILNDFLGQ
ncbi:MAG: guanylate kinase [Chitinophagales bacterium]|nr:guanylate kinase [Chitinophagales bacterium]